MKYLINGKFVKNIEHFESNGVIAVNEGKVGIMNNNPQERLDVNGNILSSGNLSLKNRNANLVIDGIDYDPVLRLKTTDDNGWTIRNDVPNNNIFSIGNDYNKNILNINNEGNVGINNSEPKYYLDITGSESDRLVNIENNNNDGSGLTIYSKKAPFKVLGGNDKLQKYFTITGSGKIGVGVENPDSHLEVNSFVDGDLVRFNNSNSSGKGLIIGADNDPLKIGKSNSLDGEIMTIKGNGNIGIGERNPDKTLVVNGTIKADRFVNKDDVLIGGQQDTTLNATRVCLDNGETGDNFEKLCLNIDDFKFLDDFKKVLQNSASERNSWMWPDS